MRKHYMLFVVLLLGITIKSFAQVAVTVTGNANTTPTLASSYTSLASALSDVNSITAMSGPIVLTLASGSETAPTSGFILGSATLNPTLNSTNTITINTSGLVTLNAPVGTATPTSASPDGIFKIAGADYVTIDGIVFSDGNTTNPASMEFGLGLFKLNAGDGAQYNRIQNCTFNMQRVNNASGTAPMVEGAIGILIINSTPSVATTALTPTSSAGTNSNNQIYTNTINGGNYGIVISGYAATVGYPLPALGDVNNDIGGAGSLMATTGNTILNFGGGASTNPSAGIRVLNQWGLNISNNIINNNNGSGVNHATTLRGIYGQSGASANVTISYNSVTLKGGGTTAALTAIENVIGATAASNTVTITNNTISNCTYTTATTATFTGILAAASAAMQMVSNNVVINNTVGNVGTSNSATFQGIYSSVTSTNFTASSNVVSNNAILNSAGTLYCIRASTSTLLFNQNVITNNRIPNSAGSSAATVYGLYDGSSPVDETYTNNIIDSLYVIGTGTSTSNNVVGIYNNTATGTKVFTGNTISNLWYSSSGAGYAFVSGIRNAYATTSTIAGNKIFNLSSTGASPTVSGLYIGSTSGTTFNVYNNIIGNLNAPASTGHNLYGIYCGSVGSSINLSYNTVYLNATSTGTNFASSAVFMSSTTPTVVLQNNILINTSVPMGTGITAAIRRTATAMTSYGTASNRNDLYVGTPSATTVLYYDGTNAYQTLSALQTPVAPREANSVSAMPSFLSTTGVSSDYLHIDPTIVTLLEGGGLPVTGIIDDYDGNLRSTTTPDIGADEFNGITPAPVLSGLTISPNSPQCIATARNIAITASTSGSPITSVIINYNNGATGSVPMTLNSGTNTNGIWTGTIPAASPVNSNVTWNVVATDGTYAASLAGMAYKDAYLQNAATNIVATPSSICAGNNASLSVTTIDGGPGFATVGTQTTTLGGVDGNPYRTGNGAGNQIRVQLLYTVSELTAMGLTAGPITSVGLTTTTTSGTVANFSIAMKHTAQATTTTSFDNAGFTTAFTQASFTPVAGLNTHTFSTPFVWDGVSNLLINFCQTNNVSGTSTVTAYTPTIPSNLNSAGTTTGCSAATGNIVSAKPILTLGGILGTSYTSTMNYTWTPTSQTGSSISVSPASTTTYTVSGIDGNGCTVMSSPATVTVNTLPTTPSATNSTQCGVGIPTAFVASTTGSNGSGTFLWYDAPNGGTLLQGAALGNTLNTYYVNDFSSSVLTNSSISGAATIGSGLLTLHPATASQQGGLTVNASGVNSNMFQTTFDLSLTAGGTTMADGFSYSFADDALATTTSPTAEHGSGSKLRIGFFTFNAANGSDGKGIYLMYNVSATTGYTSSTPGVIAYSSDVSWIPTSATTQTSPVSVSINTSGQLTLAVGATTIFNNVQLPAAFVNANKSSWKHVFASRSGGTAGGFAMDNLEIKANSVVPGYTTYQNSIAATDTFYVSEMGVNGCESQRVTVIATVTQPDVVTASSGTTPVCVNSSLALNVIQTGTNNNYTYSWTAVPSAGSGIAGGPVMGQNVSVIPTSAGTYTYTVAAYDGTLGCNTSSNVVVTVNPQPASAVVTPASAQLCPGGIQPLNINSVLQYNFGTQAAQNGTANNATDFPAPYTVWWGGQRMQMLITAAELTTAGFSAGSSINNIQFPVVSLGTNWGTTLTALQNFQVSIGSTSLSTLSAFQTGLTQVVAPAGFTPTVGYANTHNFSTPFIWDGISNLILETTFSNNVGGTANDVVVQYNSPTSYQSTIVYRADNVTAAAAASATTVSHSYSARPDFKLNGSNIIPTWTPLTGLYTDATATIPYTGGQEDTVYAKPANTTTYIATVANGAGCANTTSVTVSVGAPTVTATASINSICANTGFDLSANLLSEDFNTATNNWMLNNNSTGGTPVNSNWELRSSPYTYGTEVLSSNDASQFYISNSDAQGSGGNTLTILQSPAFNTNGMTSLTLDFYHHFRAVAGDSANVEVSTDGTNWMLVQAFTATQGTSSAFAAGSVNLNSYAGNSSVYVRFRYKAAFGWYWAIDNVKLSGSSTNTFAWTSLPSGFTSGVQNPTGVTGMDTTVYTVTVTDPNNCTATSNVTVNIQPAIAGNTIGTPQTLCSGSAPAQLTGSIPTGGSGVYAYQWQGSTTSATTGFTNVTSGGNSTDYMPAALTMTTWYRRVITSGNCSDTSAAIEITVTPGIANNTINANQNICSGATPAQLLGSTPTGAGGIYTYTWLSSSANATTGFTNAGGINTNIDYSPSSLTTNTWFRRVVNTATCTDTSTAVAIIVSLPVTGSIISAPQTICNGNTPLSLTGNFAGINEDMNGLTSTAGLTTANLPTGWMMALNQGNLLTGFNTNSYGRPGTNGAIRSNNYSVGNGNVARMDSKTFGPSLSGDTLRFDIAYAGYDDAFGPYVDTLRVYTNTGSGFTLLKQYVTGLVIDTSENGITTANWISTGFSPTASQWARKAIALPTGTTNVRFEFASGFGNRMYMDRIQTDSAAFTWLSSTTSASAGFGVASGVSNASGYAPGTLTQTTWFKRVANKGTSCSADTSAAVEITVNNGVVVGTPPQATVNVCETNTVLLSVNATNATGYQWYKGVNAVVNTTNISGATSAILRIDNATTSDAGSYSVVMNAATGCSNVTSSTSTVGVNSLGNSLATNSSSNTYVHTDGITNLYTDASCNPILKIEDAAGGNNLGSVQADVAVSGSVQTAPGGQKYLQRSYTVAPASNGAAIVTLYALQSEFTAYNAAPGSYPSMPISGNNSDPNIANIRVTKYTGSPFVGGGNALLITPTSVTWNSTANWWEITFPVSSFSSFYIHTGTVGPLSIDLRNISAVNVGTRNRIDWMTVNEKDADKFEVEGSTDGINYRKIGSVNAKGEASSYSLWDELPHQGLNHYRLKMFNLKGEFIYSTTVTAFVQSNDIFVVDAYPNPAKDELTVRINGKIGATAMITLTDIAGKLVVEQKVSDIITVIDLTKVAQGVYFMKYTDDKHSETIKVNKR